MAAHPSRGACRLSPYMIDRLVPFRSVILILARRASGRLIAALPAFGQDPSIGVVHYKCTAV
jgi:hypothetical protein